jgi:signal transduction histidine kinase
LQRAALTARLRNIALLATGLAALAAAASASAAAQAGDAHAGVVIDPGGTSVVAVAPTGFAWRDGIRPGQVVTVASRADDPGGWHVETIGPDGTIVSAEAPVQAALRGMLPLALLGLGAAGLGLAFLRANRAWALPAMCLALVAASVPLFLADHDLTGPTLALAAAVPAGAAAWRARGLPAAATAAVVGTALLLVAWQASRSTGAVLAEDLEQARRMVSVGATGLVMADAALLRDRRLAPTGFSWSGAIRWAGIPVLGVAALAFVYLATPAPLAAVLGLVALLGVPPLWTLARPRLEAVLMADLRELAAADAAEEERARIARELHDVTLQGLSAAIRRLELVPEARTETDSLRAIADELRAVAIELRPPMLDDLGLAATLDYLAEGASGSGVEVHTAIADETGIEPGSRPPAAVELALYRIAQEALANALRHAGAGEIRITARISARAIALRVADDGIGLRPDEQRRAISRGRLGLASMRRRARAIGAELSIDGGAQGTSVTVTWQD